MTEQRVNAQPGERESVAESPGPPIVNAFGQTVGFVRSHGNYVKCGGTIPVYELSTVLGEPPVRRLTEVDRDTDGLDVLPITDERPSASFRTSRGLRVMTPAERAERSAKVWDLHLRGGTIPFDEFLARRGRTTTTTTPPTEPKP